MVVSAHITFVTHSLTEDNEAGVATGWLPGRLSSRGRELAADIASQYPAAELAAIYSSDLARATETVRAAYGSDVAFRPDCRLRECSYGKLDGSPVAALVPRSRFIHAPFPGGESYLDVCRRVASFLNERRPEHYGDHILIVGHSATRWALDHLILGVAMEDLVDADFGWRLGWDYVWPQDTPSN